MGRPRRNNNQFTWVIKNFSTLQSEIIYSDEFVIGDCNWRLMAYPNGDRIRNYLSLYLDVADSKYLPCGWRRHIKLHMSVENQVFEELSHRKVKNKWLDRKTSAAGFLTMIPHSKLFDEQGFVVNGEVIVVVKIDVFEVIGKVNIIEVPDARSSEEESDTESEEASSPVKKTKLNDNGNNSNDLHNRTKQVKGSMDINGFQVLPSQAETVKRIFEKHPDMALEFRAKNHHLRTACMNVLLSLIETLCQSPQELSEEDLVEADNALAYVKDAGFKVDWLEKKLEEVKEKKEEEQNGETQIQELEFELRDFKQRCSDIESQLEKKKAKVLAARASLTLDDFV